MSNNSDDLEKKIIDEEVMKKEELIKKLEKYKKEIYRCAYILLFAVFIPIVLVFIGIGIWGNIIEYGLWAVITYIAGFTFVLLGLILLFVYIINKVLPRKIGLVCPECGQSIINNKVEEFLGTGLCAKCGVKILED